MRRACLAGLIWGAVVGCTFDNQNANDSSMLGSTAGNRMSGGTDDPTESGEDATAGSGSAEGGTSFGDTTTGLPGEECIADCVSHGPDGWLGPYYVLSGDACPGGYPEQDVAYEGLQAPAGDCACSCDTTPGSCSLSVDLAAGCGFLGAVDENVGNDDCRGLPALGFDIHARASWVGSPASCTPNPVETIQAPSWSTTTRLCMAPAIAGDCGTQRCTAVAPQAATLCIAKDGEHDCPSEAYGQRRVLHHDVSDQRTCSVCSCSGPEACSGQASAYDTGDCSGTPQAIAFDGCSDLSVSGSYSIFGQIDTGSCTPSEVQPVGEAVPSDPITICCAG